MSKSIDEKVAVLRFNNKEFEKGVDSTLKRVDDLNKGLKLDGASKGLEKVAQKADKLDLSRMEKSVDVVQAKISALQTMFMTFVSRATNAAIDLGKKTFDAFAIQPVTTGFNEYELKMGSVQTIMASTGASVEEVNKQLDELNKYSDKTIYSFADMTTNIGKFTNAGVGLEDAVAAIKGISNEAALSGANANEASRAMYNFAQALSAGYVKLIDWKSIENANMATVEFKNELLKTAVEIGTVAETSSGMYQVLTKNATGSAMSEAVDATHNFNESLQQQWMTTEVLTRTLAKYADETTDIGKKAYAAAQDVKTFSMMMDTLKEAAQSGWAETWQLVVGDFEEAKSLWTGMSNFFGDIIASSAEARNKLIGNAMTLVDENGVSGRMALWEGVNNILKSVTQTLGAVRGAFFEVFPPITDQKLRQLIENFKNFSSALVQNEERLGKIKNVFKGIFAVLDIFVTTIRFAFRVATNIISAFVSTATGLISIGAKLIIDWAMSIDTATRGFAGYIRNIRDGFREFIEYVNKLEGGLSIKNLFKALGAFNEKVISKIFSFDAFVGSWENFMVKLQGIFDEAGDNTQGATSKIMRIVSNLIRFLQKSGSIVLDIVVGITQSITPEQVLAVGMGAALLMIIKILTDFAGSFSRVADALTKTFDQVGKTMKAFAFEAKSEAMWNFAKSIALLVGSLALLTGIADDPNFTKSAITLGIIAAGITAMTIVMSKFSGTAKASLSLTAMLIGMSVAIKGLAKSMEILNAMDFENGNVKNSLVLLGALAAGLVVVGKVLGKDSKVYAVSALSMVGFALALNVLVDTFERLIDKDLTGTKHALQTLFGLVGIMTLLGIKIGKVSIGVPATILAMVVGIKVILSAMDDLKGYSDTEINRAILTIAKIFGSFAILMGVMSLANMHLNSVEDTSENGKKSTKKSSDNIKQIGNAIIKMSAALLVVGAAIAIFNKFDESEIKKAEGIILKLMLVFGVLTALSGLSGENADKAGKMIQRMSVALIAVSAVVAVLTLFDDPSVLQKPLRMIEELLLVMDAVVALSGLAGKDKDVGKTINSMTLAAVALGTLVAALSIISPENLDNAVKAISMVIAVFGAAVAATKLAKDSAKTIIMMNATAVILAGLITALSALEVEDGLENAKALSLLMVALSGSMAILGKTDKIDNKIIGQFMVLSAVAMVMMKAFQSLNTIDTETTLVTAAALGGIFLAMSKSLAILGDAEAPTMKALGTMALLTALFAVLPGILGWLESKDWAVSISSATAMGVMAITLAEAFKLLSKAEAPNDGVIEDFIKMGIVVGLIAGIVGGLEALGLTTGIENAVSLGVLLLAMSESMQILVKSGKIDSSVVGQMALMGLVVGEVASIVGGLESAGIQVGITNAIALSALMIGLSKAAEMCAKAGQAGSAGFIGIGILITLVAAVGTLMWGVGALTREHPTIMDDIDTAIEVLSKIGYGIGSFVGNIVGGVLGGITDGTLTGVGNGLSNMATSMMPFFTIMNALPNDVFQKTKDLASALLTITATQLLDQISKWIGGSNSIEDFAGGLNSLGEGLVEFSETTAGISNSEGTSQAIALMKELAAAAKEIPNTGGLLGAIVGNNDMSKWAAQMPMLGFGLVNFAAQTANIVVSKQTEDAIVLMKKLASASKEIPNTGGALGFLIGDNDMGPWAEQMKPLAQGIVSFAYQTQNLTGGKNAEAAIEIMKKLASASKEIPNTGGALGLLVGNNDMDTFAIGIKPIGEGIMAFCTAVDGIPVGSVDNALTAMKKLYEFQGDLKQVNKGSIDAFGQAITSLAMAMLLYSKSIDLIRDFDVFERSVRAVMNLATMAKLVGDTKTGQLNTFGKELIEFAETSLVKFNEVFTKSGNTKIGKDLGLHIVKGLRTTKVSFTAATNEMISTILKALNGSLESMRQKGQQYAAFFVNGMTSGFSANSAGGGLNRVGKNVVQGLSNGFKSGSNQLIETSNSVYDAFINNAYNKFQVHSPSKLFENLGLNIDLGWAGGLQRGFNTVQSTMGMNIANLKTQAIQGNNEISGILSNMGSGTLLDSAAGIGDKLAGWASGYKEKLLGPDSIGGIFNFPQMQTDVQKQITKSLNDGIGAGFNDVAAGLTGGGGGGGGASAGAENLAESLKLSLHKHFDSSEYIYLGQHIGETMVIAMNGAIVSGTDSTKAKLEEVMDAAGKGIEYWRAWTEAQEEYGKISQSELLEGWKAVQDKYKEGTQERMEADKQVYALQKELVKATFNYSKQWIDNEKYYDRLTKEEELNAWIRVQNRYLEGSQERIEADKEVYRIKKELREQDFQDAINNIERLKKVENISTSAEIGLYEGLLRNSTYTAEMRLEIEDKIFDAKKNQYSEAKKQINHLKAMDQLTKNQELKHYQSLIKLTTANSDERMELEEKIYSLQKEINQAQEDHAKEIAEIEEDARQKRLEAEKEYADNVREVEEKLAQDIADLNQKYEDAVRQREKTLYQAWGLFDEVKDSDYDGTIFLENLGYQVESYKAWEKEMNILAAKGVDSALLDELREMGPQALEQLRALNALTSTQLTQYVELWREKHKLSHDLAVKELEGLRSDTDKQIEALRNEAAKKLEEYRQTWQNVMSNISNDVKLKLDEIAASFKKTIGDASDMVKELGKLDEQAAQQAASTAGKYGLYVKNPDGTRRPANANDFKPGGVYSQSDLWTNTMNDLGVKTSSSSSSIGKNISSGIANGMSSSTGKVAAAAGAVVATVVGALKGGLKVRSPSKVTQEIGEFTTKGFVKGLLLYSIEAFDAGYRIGDALVDGVASAGVYLQELLDNELDLNPQIVPVLDVSGIENGVENFDEIMANSRAFNDALNAAVEATNAVNRQRLLEMGDPNLTVVGELKALRGDIQNLGDRMAGMEMVLDTGTLVGEIVNPLDTAFGNAISRNTRERG